jgi:glyoxylase-like metal-dependent hydrolase (beta-lactamase superfamily II)
MLPEGFIFIQRDWLSSNSLLLKNDNETFLIDSGYVSHAEMTLDALRHHLSGQPLDAILNTHLHSDHCGGNANLQFHYPSLSIYVPATQFDIVNSWDKSSLSFEMTGQSCNRFTASSKLFADNSIELLGLPWQIVGSPGHDSDSVMFFQPDFKILVSADALWESGVSVVFPEFADEPGFEDVLYTLDLIEKLNPSLVIPGHGSLFTDVASAINSSRVKLKQFINDPRYHALYTAKVMLKFKLMEINRVQLDTFLAWGSKSTLLKQLHSGFFEQQEFQNWFVDLLEDLKRKLAISIVDQWIINL